MNTELIVEYNQQYGAYIINIKIKLILTSPGRIFFSKCHHFKFVKTEPSIYTDTPIGKATIDGSQNAKCITHVDSLQHPCLII